MATEFHRHLIGILDKYKISDYDLQRIDNIFREFTDDILYPIRNKNPRIYKGGSHGKGTAIGQSYDLDIVIYFPSSCYESPKQLFELVRRTIAERNIRINQHYGVAIQVDYKGYSIDIVPGKAIGQDYQIANLYNIAKNQNMRTSLQEHISSVQEVLQIVRIMKIWRSNHNLSIHKMALEQIIIDALDGKNISDFGDSIKTILLYIKSNIQDKKFIDPANSNNHITVSTVERENVRKVAENNYSNFSYNNWQKIIW
jgi:hypothetical protein